MLLTVATAIPFLPILGNQFVAWDDAETFLNNPHYRGLGWPQISWMFTTFHTGHYQPLSWVTLGFDYLFWGMDPFGYHLTNLLIHTGNTLLFFFVSRRLLSIARSVPDDGQSWQQLQLGAAAAALLFGIHPLRVESVAWATERRDVLSGLFYLLTVHAYLRAATSRRLGPPRWLFVAYVSYALSLLAKGTAMTLPAILILVDIYPLRRFKGSPAQWLRPDQRHLWLEKLPFVLLACTFAVIALNAQSSAGALKTLAQYDFFPRIGQACYGILFYLWKSVLPLGLSPLYELPPLDDGWRWIFALSAAGALATTLGLFAARRRWPAVLACWVYYLIVLAPVSGVAQSGPQLVADRYSYLACLSWAILLGGALFQGSRLVAFPKPLQLYSGAMLSFAVMVLLSLGWLTWQQSGVWRDTRTLWQHAIAVTPNSSMASYNLGKTFEADNDADAAIKLYRSAVNLNPAYANAHRSLGDMLLRKGSLVDALAHYRKAIEIRSDDAETHNNLGVLQEMRGELAVARDEFHQAVRLDPKFARAYFNLGRVSAQQGDLGQSADYYRKAVELDPGEPVILVNLAEVLGRRGELQAAIDSLLSAIALKPDLAAAHELLARLLNAQGKQLEARKHYDEAIRLMRAERNRPDAGSAVPRS